MKTFEHPLYLDDVSRVCRDLSLKERLEGACVLISGAGGLLGSFLTDVLMEAGCKVIALGRNEAKARDRFAAYWDKTEFVFIAHDINKPLDIGGLKPDYVIHLASNTHPVAYATQPVSTIITNVVGTMNMLEVARSSESGRFVFASSNEVYGQNRGDCELFAEDYCGYIDSNTLRAGYPESKRCGEALCQAYIHQYGLDAVVARFTRSYGPTVLDTDTKASSQFIRNALKHEDIVLKSEGNQFFSYCYMADSISGLLRIMLDGVCGSAYNISDESSDVTLKELAYGIASAVGAKVVFDLPSDTEKAGFSTAVKARLDGSRLKSLGWMPHYDIVSGMERTIRILSDCKSEL